MNFNFPLLGPIRMLLFPVSLVYYAVVWCRNRLYDYNIFKSASFNLPLICVGNLSIGGTGKSPMVEYLARMLQHEVALATLSRGYKRKTRGYALANERSTALDIGDEPMLFHLKFPRIAVAVGEERLVAIPQLLHDRPDTRLIILDDAFQHRAVKAGLNILLVDYNNLFTRDWYLPTGDLRDEKKSYKRAQIIVITKCPANMTEEKKQSILREIEPLANQSVFFSAIRYGFPYHLVTKENTSITRQTEVLLVTGIANPKPLEKLLHDTCAAYIEIRYSDHKIFSIDDLKHILEKFHEMDVKDKIILTTEKDAVRLSKFENELRAHPIYVMPIEHEFLFNDSARFNGVVKAFIEKYKQTL